MVSGFYLFRDGGMACIGYDFNGVACYSPLDRYAVKPAILEQDIVFSLENTTGLVYVKSNAEYIYPDSDGDREPLLVESAIKDPALAAAYRIAYARCNDGTFQPGPL